MLAIEENDLNDTENTDEDHGFDWGADAGDVIVREQPAIACYVNPAGDIVLRQRGYPEDDAWIWFAPGHALAIAAAILEAAGLEVTATALTAEPHRR